MECLAHYFNQAQAWEVVVTYKQKDLPTDVAVPGLKRASEGAIRVIFEATHARVSWPVRRHGFRKKQGGARIGNGR